MHNNQHGNRVDYMISVQSTKQRSAFQQPTFTSLDTLGPRMDELFVASISTVLYPSTTSSATATFTSFFSVAALRAYGYGNRWRRRGKGRLRGALSYWCWARVDYAATQLTVKTAQQTWNNPNLQWLQIEETQGFPLPLAHS